MVGRLKKLLPAKLRAKLGSDDVVIPVVKLSGAISDGGTAFRPTLNLGSCSLRLEKAFQTKGSPAVAIIVNSPGGSPVQSRLIYQRIRALSAEHNKKVHVFVEDAAASGGYMIACAGDDITADPSSIVGSIGVISASFGYVDAIEKIGVKRRVYTAGQNKSVLDPFLPEKKADIDRLKALQLEIHQIFIDLVKQSRGDRLIEHKDMFTGQFWTGGKGKELGLVDEIGDLRSSLQARYGKKTKIKLVEAKRGLFGNRVAAGVSTVTGFDGEALAAGAASGIMTAAEEKLLWNRLGL
ncbi:MAG: S49 family peptidase [Rhizobiaceae bacterium]|nr:S49 family peptidase [Rhizobiaceae bacterium]